MTPRTWVWKALLLVLLPSTGCNGSNAPVNAERQEQGRALYNYRCYFCHGYSGNARTLATTYMDPKPRDFTRVSPDQLSRSQMITAVTHGKPATAMTGFSRLLDREEIEAVVDFVRQEFMVEHAENTRYHTPANGWPDHLRYTAAFPFATGEVALDTPWEQLEPAQRMGKQLFLTSCITCHDRSRVNNEGPVWYSQALSYPRNNHSHTQIDAVTSASTFALHDRAPVTVALSEQQVRGKSLFDENCAFCHGKAGTGRNWIGSFLEPKPQDLTDPAYMSRINRAYLRQIIEDGLPNSSMPAWRSVLDDAQIDAVIDYISIAFHPL